MFLPVVLKAVINDLIGSANRPIDKQSLVVLY